MSPLVRGLVLWVHLAGVVIWFGAVAYFLLVLRPAVRASGMQRPEWYLLLRHLKRRLRRVVGGAVVAVVASGLVLAHARGLLNAPPWALGWPGRIFGAKLALAALLVAVYLAALPLIERIRAPRARGRAFVWTHAAALALGSAAALLGLLLHG